MILILIGHGQDEKCPSRQNEIRKERGVEGAGVVPGDSRRGESERFTLKWAQADLLSSCPRPLMHFIFPCIVRVSTMNISEQVPRCLSLVKFRNILGRCHHRSAWTHIPVLPLFSYRQWEIDRGKGWLWLILYEESLRLYGYQTDSSDIGNWNTVA